MDRYLVPLQEHPVSRKGFYLRFACLDGEFGSSRHNPHLSKQNLRLDNELEIANELKDYKSNGGATIVDLTPDGIGRNPIALKRIAKMSGVNVLIATGWYKYATHPTLVRKSSADQLAEILVSELTEGIGNTGSKAGVIGECAASSPLLYHFEKRKF